GALRPAGRVRRPTPRDHTEGGQGAPLGRVSSGQAAVRRAAGGSCGDLREARSSPRLQAVSVHGPWRPEGHREGRPEGRRDRHLELGRMSALWQPQWQASHAYALTAVVIPTTFTGYTWRCTTAGTSAGVEPALPADP